MSDLLLVRGLLFAGECFAVSLVLPLLAFAATALMRRAALRHLAWTTLFGVLAVLPIAALLLPARQIVAHGAATAAMPVQAPAMVEMPAPAMPVPMPAPSWSDLLTLENIVLFVVALWLVGLVWQVLRLGLGGIGLMRLRRASVPFASEIETGCAVRLAHDEAGPSTFGILRPMVLLPRAAAGWPVARLEAVLRHEAAHVARRDVASQFIARLVCGLYWINPLLWLAYRALRRDAELAADDAVVAGGMTPSVYATELVRLAADARGVTPGVAMAGPPLTKRVEAVLSENSSRKGVTKMDMAKMGLLGLTATLLLGAARFDLAVAQDAPPAPRTPRPAAASQVPPRVNVERRVNADVERRVNVTVERQVDTDVQRAIEVKTAAVKANIDVIIANARAKAAAETDPKAKEMLRQQAEETAAQGAVDKADADLALARARQAARERAEADARPARVTIDRLSADRARLEETQQRMAQARARVGADAQRARDVLRIQKTDTTTGVRTDFGLSFQPDPLEIDTGPLSAATAAAMQRPEVHRAIEEAVAVAMAEARRAISTAVAKAVADAAAAAPVPPAPPSVRALPVPPVPPAPPLN